MRLTRILAERILTTKASAKTSSEGHSVFSGLFCDYMCNLCHLYSQLKSPRFFANLRALAAHVVLAVGTSASRACFCCCCCCCCCCRRRRRRRCCCCGCCRRRRCCCCCQITFALPICAWYILHHRSFALTLALGSRVKVNFSLKGWVLLGTSCLLLLQNF